MKTTTTWQIAIWHQAFGYECAREYHGSELGARRAAHKSARAAGHGWQAIVRAVGP